MFIENGHAYSWRKVIICSPSLLLLSHLSYHFPVNFTNLHNHSFVYVLGLSVKAMDAVLLIICLLIILGIWQLLISYSGHGGWVGIEYTEMFQSYSMNDQAFRSMNIKVLWSTPQGIYTMLLMFFLCLNIRKILQRDDCIGTERN